MVGSSVLDMHVHILPGVDDGARNMNDTKRMLECAKECGITVMVATPHLWPMRDAVKSMRPYVEVRDMATSFGISLHRGFEVSHLTIVPGRAEIVDEYCLAGTKCFLLELDNGMLMPRWESYLCDLVRRGYNPIIAHPERYTYIQKDFEIASEMYSYGCRFQISAGGLFAGAWTGEQRVARRFLGSGFTSYVASDAHSFKDFAVFQRAARTFSSEWPQDGYLLQMLD